MASTVFQTLLFLLEGVRGQGQVAWCLFKTLLFLLEGVGGQGQVAWCLFKTLLFLVDQGPRSRSRSRSMFKDYLVAQPGGLDGPLQVEPDGLGGAGGGSS